MLKERAKLSVVIPVFNEEAVLNEFYNRLVSVLDKIPMDAEIIFINDGSTDSSLSLMKSLYLQDKRVAVLDLSRNFGKEIALTAGLDHISGHAAVVIDADLQDPPELIPEMITCWNDGFDVVYAKRTSRQGESFVKKGTAFIFYRFMQHISRIKIPEDTGDYRLLSRRAVDAVRSAREHHRFMKGLFAWIGFRQKAIEYIRDPRFAGKTKWNYFKLIGLAIEGITSFSTLPLKLASYLGISIAFYALLYALWIIYKTTVFGEIVRGYPTMMVVILFLGGIQLFTIGIIGEYLGRIFNETKSRPLYFVNDFYISSRDSQNNK